MVIWNKNYKQITPYNWTVMFKLRIWMIDRLDQTKQIITLNRSSACIHPYNKMEIPKLINCIEIYIYEKLIYIIIFI